MEVDGRVGGGGGRGWNSDYKQGIKYDYNAVLFFCFFLVFVCLIVVVVVVVVFFFF